MTARWPVLSDRVGVQDRHDFERGASSIDHSDEIPFIEKELAFWDRVVPSQRPATMLANMRARLEWLKATEK